MRCSRDSVPCSHGQWGPPALKPIAGHSSTGSVEPAGPVYPLPRGCRPAAPEYPPGGRAGDSRYIWGSNPRANGITDESDRAGRVQRADARDHWRTRPLLPGRAPLSLARGSGAGGRPDPGILERARGTLGLIDGGDPRPWLAEVVANAVGTVQPIRQ